MLGRLRMSTREALTEYVSIMRTVFSDDNKKIPGQDGTFMASTLEKELRNLVAARCPEYTGDEFMLENNDKSETGKVSVLYLMCIPRETDNIH